MMRSSSLSCASYQPIFANNLSSMPRISREMQSQMTNDAFRAERKQQPADKSLEPKREKHQPTEYMHDEDRGLVPVLAGRPDNGARNEYARVRGKQEQPGRLTTEEQFYQAYINTGYTEEEARSAAQFYARKNAEDAKRSTAKNESEDLPKAA